MKILKKILPIVIIVVVVGLIYSFFHIEGREIKNLSSLNEAESVDLTVRDLNTDETVNYELSKSQIEKLQTLFWENSYTRRISNTIIGVLPDKRYTILTNWDDGGQKHLYISLIGGEYISVAGQFGNSYNKIKNPNFEKDLISILELNEGENNDEK